MGHCTGPARLRLGSAPVWSGPAQLGHDTGPGHPARPAGQPNPSCGCPAAAVAGGGVMGGGGGEEGGLEETQGDGDAATTVS